jgi:hypothetical protein
MGTHILFYMMRSKGPILIYSSFVLMEGLEIFNIYFIFIDYSNFNNKGEGDDYYRYVEFNGNIDKEQRKKYLSEFNNEEYIYGSKIKVFFISPAGAEGISLMNVRQVHIMEPYWNEARNIQLNRTCCTFLFA